MTKEDSDYLEKLQNETSIISSHLAAIVESCDDAIISKNFDGIIQSWNRAAERVFGYTADEAIGKHISLIIPEHKKDEENHIISTIKSGGRLENFETERITKQGRLVHLSLTVSPIRNKDGVIIGASKIARDFSERKNTERQLLEEREALETLNRLAPALASTMDLEYLVQLATDEATKITGAKFGAFFYNVINDDGKAYWLYTLSGAPKESFSNLGMPRVTDLFSSTFRGEGTVLLNDVTLDHRYGKSEPYYGMPKGHLPVKSYLAVPVMARNGTVIGGLLFGHPDTGIFSERDARLAEGISALAAVGIENARLYEEVKTEKNKAEDASRVKSEFLATISHEIRTPMNAIIGLTNILAMSSPLSHKQVEFISTLQKSADTLLVLINDLLDISKIEAQTIELEKVPFSLMHLIHEIVDMMGMRAQEKNLNFVVDTKNIEKLIFIGDPTRLKQVISNLCSNAIKFTDRGSISINVECKQRMYPGHLLVSLSVKDTGIGIAQEKLESIFEKFVQADSSISRKYGGTGLGLSITKKLVEVMGGTISVESKIGVGSTFIVTVPLRLASEAIASATMIVSCVKADKNDEHENPVKKVMVVEDYEPNIVVACAFLDAMGYSHKVARTGREALKHLETEGYDAIMMDVQMPDLNGYETTQLIRKYELLVQRKKTPIIGVTANAMRGDKERCLNAGMNAYLSKPFNFNELKESLEKLMQKH